jgi:8-oxo-dGTP pyrophosphatase MutT (NUDIX family)
MSYSTAEQGLFIVVVGAVIEYPATEEILLLKRSDDVNREPGIWEDPAGRMQQHEEPESALRREVKEECGLDVTIIKPLNVFHEYRDPAASEGECVGIIYWCRTTSREVRLSNEHCEHRWLRPYEALELVDHPGVRDDIRAFLREKQRTV